MAKWDVCRRDRMQVQKGLNGRDVRAAVARGELGPDDLFRPSDTETAWKPLRDVPGLFPSSTAARPASAPTADREPPPSVAPPSRARDQDDEGEEEDDERVSQFRMDPEEEGEDDAPLPSIPALVPNEDEIAEYEADYDPEEEDEAAAEFTLTRGAPQRIDELDLAAMVDVAFQMVLFFMVTATTVLYKTLEVPKPNPEQAKSAQSQGQSRTLEDLQKDFILVDIDSTGAMKIDHEPVRAEMSALAERLRAARQTTGRTAMLMTADATTLHRYAVTAYDAANEIGLRIAIANPKTAPGPPPVPPATPPAAGPPASE